MKKLLFCTQSYITGGGGVASYAHDFVNAFISQYDICVVTSDKYEKQQDDIVDIYHLNGGDFNTDNAVSFLSLIERLEPNIIVNSSYPLIALVSPYVSNDIKIISVSHFVDGILSWYAGFNANYADQIISLSSFGKTYLEEKFHIADKEKVKVVFNFMPEITPRYEQKQNRKVLKIVYPGGCSYAKSAEVVCLALKKLLKTDLDFKFYWLGSTKIAGGENCHFRTRHVEDCLPSDDRIKHIGPVPREESKAILSDANIFLLPSRGEGFPITLIEAMRSGCIVIISDAHHGSLDAIKNGVNGLVVRQGNSGDIVKKIIDIVSNHDKYNNLYEASYLYYEQHLTQKVWKRNMENFIAMDTTHNPRLPQFDIARFSKDSCRLRLMMKKYWIKDRFHQLYHFLVFRWIKYCC